MQAVSSSKLRIVQTAHNSVSCPAAAPRACMAGLLQFAGPLRQSLASSAGLVPRAYASALSVRSVAASAVAMSKAQGTVKWCGLFTAATALACTLFVIASWPYTVLECMNPYINPSSAGFSPDLAALGKTI